MTDKAVALAIRETFPKHTPGALSYALNTKTTGVMLCPKAQSIYDALRPPKKKRVCRRVKSVEFRARLTQETAEAVKQKMEAIGIASKQTLVEALLLRWVKEKAPAAATAETNSERKY